MNQTNLELMKRDMNSLLKYIYDTDNKLSIVKAKIEEGGVINWKTLDDCKIEKVLYKPGFVIGILINIFKHCNQRLYLIETTGDVNFGGEI